MTDTPKATSPQEGTNNLPRGPVPMEDYYMPHPDQEELTDAAKGHIATRPAR